MVVLSRFPAWAPASRGGISGCRAIPVRENDGYASLGCPHKDELLWDVVAFVRKLPELTPEQYETLMKNAPKHEELMREMGSDHGHSGKHE
jgi:hypothetical protein